MRSLLVLVIASVWATVWSLSAPARAATFRAVHEVRGDVYVELDAAFDRGGAAGPVMALASETPRAAVRRFPAGTDVGRAVRLVSEDGSCDGRLGREVLLGLYEPGPGDEDSESGDPARWMLAARVHGCQGPFALAVLDPPADVDEPRALTPADESADAAVEAALTRTRDSDALTRARAEWTAADGPPTELERGSAWRVGRVDGHVLGVGEVVLGDLECGGGLVVRTIVRRSRGAMPGRMRVVVAPAAHELPDEVAFIADLDADGAPELVLRGALDHVQVLRLPLDGGAPTVLLDEGGIPAYGCTC